MHLMFILSTIFLSSTSYAFSADQFGDYRCKCVCPSFTVVPDPMMNATRRRIFIDTVPPENCTCYSIVFQNVTASKSFQERFCPRCVCNYEVRNTKTMKIVVIIIIIITSSLFVYMVFLYCLESFMQKTTKPITTLPVTDDGQPSASDSNLEYSNQECTFREPNTEERQHDRRRSVGFNLVTEEQARWRRQVHQQQQSVYSKHEMLN